MPFQPRWQSHSRPMPCQFGMFWHCPFDMQRHHIDIRQRRHHVDIRAARRHEIVHATRDLAANLDPARSSTGRSAADIRLPKSLVSFSLALRRPRPSAGRPRSPGQLKSLIGAITVHRTRLCPRLWHARRIAILSWKLLVTFQLEFLDRLLGSSAMSETRIYCCSRSVTHSKTNAARSRCKQL